MSFCPPSLVQDTNSNEKLKEQQTLYQVGEPTLDLSAGLEGKPGAWAGGAVPPSSGYGAAGEQRAQMGRMQNAARLPGTSSAGEGKRNGPQNPHVFPHTTNTKLAHLWTGHPPTAPPTSPQSTAEEKAQRNAHFRGGGRRGEHSAPTQTFLTLGRLVVVWRPVGAEGREKREESYGGKQEQRDRQQQQQQQHTTEGRRKTDRQGCH